jgi:hypothetical protein
MRLASRLLIACVALLVPAPPADAGGHLLCGRCLHVVMRGTATALPDGFTWSGTAAGIDVSNGIPEVAEVDYEATGTYDPGSPSAGVMRASGRITLFESGTDTVIFSAPVTILGGQAGWVVEFYSPPVLFGATLILGAYAPAGTAGYAGSLLVNAV